MFLECRGARGGRKGRCHLHRGTGVDQEGCPSTHTYTHKCTCTHPYINTLTACI